MRYKHQMIMIALIAGLFSGWTPSQKVLWGTYTAAWAVDLGQTRHIAKNPDYFHENSARYAIGEHPSVGDVHAFFVAHYIKNYIIAEILGDKWRSIYLGSITVEHGLCIGNNKSIGIKVDLKF